MSWAMLVASLNTLMGKVLKEGASREARPLFLSELDSSHTRN